MRATRLLLGLATSFAVVACVASGCSSGSTAAPPADSGAAQDVTTDVEVEAAVEAAAEAAPEAAVEAGCVPDSSISSLAVPDASYGDSGVNISACISCLETECPMVIAQCNMSCTCVDGVNAFAACIAMPGSSLLTCAGTLASTGITPSSCGAALGCAGLCGYNPTTDGGGPKNDGGTGDGAAE